MPEPKPAGQPPPTVTQSMTSPSHIGPVAAPESVSVPLAIEPEKVDFVAKSMPHWPKAWDWLFPLTKMTEPDARQSCDDMTGVEALIPGMSEGNRVLK